MKQVDPAEALLKALGITEPREIVLEDIAFDQGAEVRFKKLCGCEADIIGFKDKAIITVDKSKSDTRARFSIAHELGHWHHHRGQRLQCRVEDFQPKIKQLAERKANNYASSLLMPNYLLTPRAKDHQRLNFSVVEQFAHEFRTSLTATAIRLVEADIWPCMLIHHTQSGRKWFTQARMFHKRWFPKGDVDASSCAFDVVFGNSPGNKFAQNIGADYWFDRQEARKYEILEQAKSIGSGEALILLTIKNEKMMDEEPEQLGWR
ncbi:MAG: ImmA/IrrE family metallo-endopeptidase [Pseudomonadota bacterium]